MAKRPKWARVKPEELQKRILELESEHGVSGLGKLLGVSRDSIRRYRDGETFPQNKEVYQKINSLYRKERPKINPQKVEQIQKKIKKQSEAQKYGRIKSRYIPIYPDYMYNGRASEFDGVKSWDKLEGLSEDGFVAAWYGRDIIPLEVQFLAEGAGTSLKRFGQIVNIVGLVTRTGYPKDGNFTGFETELVILPTYRRLIKRLKKSMDYDTRHEVIREFFLNLEIEKGYPIVYLGYYFNEGDES